MICRRTENTTRELTPGLAGVRATAIWLTLVSDCRGVGENPFWGSGGLGLVLALPPVSCGSQNCI